VVALILEIIHLRFGDGLGRASPNRRYRDRGGWVTAAGSRFDKRPKVSRNRWTRPCAPPRMKRRLPAARDFCAPNARTRVKLQPGWEPGDFSVTEPALARGHNGVADQLP
jgi:hypothetical protein